MITQTRALRPARTVADVRLADLCERDAKFDQLRSAPIIVSDGEGLHPAGA